MEAQEKEQFLENRRTPSGSFLFIVGVKFTEVYNLIQKNNF